MNRGYAKCNHATVQFCQQNNQSIEFSQLLVKQSLILVSMEDSSLISNLKIEEVIILTLEVLRLLTNIHKELIIIDLEQHPFPVSGEGREATNQGGFHLKLYYNNYS